MFPYALEPCNRILLKRRGFAFGPKIARHNPRNCAVPELFRCQSFEQGHHRPICFVILAVKEAIIGAKPPSTWLEAHDRGWQTCFWPDVAGVQEMPNSMKDDALTIVVGRLPTPPVLEANNNSIGNQMPLAELLDFTEVQIVQVTQQLTSFLLRKAGNERRHGRLMFTPRTRKS